MARHEGRRRGEEPEQSDSFLLAFFVLAGKALFRKTVEWYCSGSGYFRLILRYLGDGGGPVSRWWVAVADNLYSRTITTTIAI